MNIRLFWKAVLEQDRATIKGSLQNTVHVNWHCINECFTVDGFIQVNYEYPGDWDGKVERIECVGNLIITTTHVFPKDRSSSFYVAPFFRIEDEKIVSADEYRSDGGEVPLWRKEACIGKPINQPIVSKAQNELVIGQENR